MVYITDNFTDSPLQTRFSQSEINKRLANISLGVQFKIKTEAGDIAGTARSKDALQATLYEGLDDFNNRTSFIITNSGIDCDLGSVSIKSAANPNQFWRHYYGYMLLQDNNTIADGNKIGDACWYVIKNPKCSDTAVSFYSRNSPTAAITKCDHTKRLHIKPDDDNCGNNANKCWLLEPIGNSNQEAPAPAPALDPWHLGTCHHHTSCAASGYPLICGFSAAKEEEKR